MENRPDAIGDASLPLARVAAHRMPGGASTPGLRSHLPGDRNCDSHRGEKQGSGCAKLCQGNQHRRFSLICQIFCQKRVAWGWRCGPWQCRVAICTARTTRRRDTRGSGKGGPAWPSWPKRLSWGTMLNRLKLPVRRSLGLDLWGIGSQRACMADLDRPAPRDRIPDQFRALVM